MRVGLVLGAGGVVGAAWLIGALQALEAETGWSPQAADRIVGTSAGSVIGALTAAGVTPEALVGYASGETREDPAEVAEVERLADEIADPWVGAEYRLTLPRLGPGSWRLGVATLMHPRSHSPAALLSGWLPRGVVSTDPIRELVERFVPGDWPKHRSYWAVACDYSTGRRIAFGSAGAPVARVGQAVAASCAIPAFYHPVKIRGRRYVDGGIHSVSNLDLLAGRELDLVVCLNPMSTRARVEARTPPERVAANLRASAGRRLGSEVRKLREQGTEVLLIQPSGADLAVMGVNLMARDRRGAVIETALGSTTRALRRLGDRQTMPPRTVRRRSAPRGGRAA
ncbi:MAG: patatin-like phospholipase family protein [Solirubrobacteraceae bacterium]